MMNMWGFELLVGESALLLVVFYVSALVGSFAFGSVDGSHRPDKDL